MGQKRTVEVLNSCALNSCWLNRRRTNIMTVQYMRRGNKSFIWKCLYVNEGFNESHFFTFDEIEISISMSKSEFRFRFRFRLFTFDEIEISFWFCENFYVEIGISILVLFAESEFRFVTIFQYQYRNFKAFFTEIGQHFYFDCLLEFGFRPLIS
jgi:hypothetical protein